MAAWPGALPERHANHRRLLPS